MMIRFGLAVLKMEVSLLDSLNNGSVKIYCATGSERKIWHEWANMNNLISKTSIDKNLPPAILYKCDILE